MKQAIDIELTTLQVGFHRKIVTLGINGKDEAEKFLKKLERSDPRNLEGIIARLRIISDQPGTENPHILKFLRNGIYEIKKGHLRLYGFYHDLHDEACLVICTNGGKKNTKKEQTADIQKAQKLRSNFFKAIKSDTTSITIADPQP